MIFKIILAALLSLPIPGFERVLADSCQDFPLPEVALNINTGTILERFDVTANELQRAAASSGIQPHWPGLGVYVSDITYAANIFENAQDAGNGLYCAAVASVQVELSLKNRIIH